MKKKLIFNGISTNSIHIDEQYTDSHNAHLTPIYANSTYFFENAKDGQELFSGAKQGYTYGRFGNPTNNSIENIIAKLEGLNANKDNSNLELKAILHSSGMAAIHTILVSNLKQGDKILTHTSLYGGTSVLLDTILTQYGIETIVSDFKDLNKIESILKFDIKLKLIYLETPANPTLQCIDIENVCQLAKKYGQKTICDNTFNTPYIQQPFKYGIDFVVHSTTKFLNGHGTAIGGILLGKDIDFMTQKVKKVFNLTGPCASPFDAFLITNGIKTLELRMQKHCENANKLALFLKKQKQILNISYLGFEENEYHKIAKKQMKYFGSLINIELDGDYETCMKFMDSLQLCTKAVSLGTCDTMICHTYSTTHLAVSKENKKLYGIKDNQLRITVGIENIEDIIADFENALNELN